ncbi:hypothetical protein ABZ628_28955 [Streptomyces diastaticus]|uniref:hypothetical protein n=1 Tax=Streptomyces TaxID=1883 RepID=UPI001FFEB0FC|nr:hypothetical protein [Streptomyces sp. WAC00276]MCK2145289.1 hypothetical protein [Streptomyces sp. WAC00276]
MDTALLGVICGFAGTVLGGAVAYFGPLQVERRRARSERELRAEDRISADIDRYIAVRVVADQWLDLLRRAHESAVDGSLDLERFDADALRYSDELRLRLAELAHLGVTDTGTDDMFHMLRKSTGQIRRLASGWDDRLFETDNRGDRCFRGIGTCQQSRADWAMLVLDKLSLRTGRDLSPRERS